MNIMQAVIYVAPGDDCWVADFSEHPDCEEILEVMGTAVLPTPYFLTTPVELVVEGIAKRNPGCAVVARQ